MRYALIKNGTVQNVIEADADFIASFAQGFDSVIQSDTANFGWAYDGVNFTAPVQPASVETALTAQPWTKKEFLLRFTATEYGAIKAATLVSRDVDYYWALFNAAENVLKTDPMTIAGINTLELAGLIGPGRAAEILA